ncbi:DUF4362 domain-containing protein [Brevibacillus migulae]|uniref:DUF4362 domain-containing protein n=1 Tax=Brevibacillus migulae TaxID=1644114 RepID=UPI001430924F|nr:DUF4362 domain-containing protein [Brevibacillus migulae]
MQSSARSSLEEARRDDQVIVSRSLGFGSTNAAHYGSFTEKWQVGIFVKAIQSANKIQGILDVDQPDYDVVIEHDGKQWEIHLWLDAQGKHGMYTYVSNTDTGYQITAESTRELHNLIWGLKYDPKQAMANGDIVNVHGELSNLDVWEKFVANVKARVRDEVQIVKYTIEGEPIFDNLSFDGETIKHIYDNTHDVYGKPTKLYEFCKSIGEKKTDSGTEYYLTDCGKGDAYIREGMFNLRIENK